MSSVSRDVLATISEISHNYEIDQSTMIEATYFNIYENILDKCLLDAVYRNIRNLIISKLKDTHCTNPICHATVWKMLCSKGAVRRDVHKFEDEGKLWAKQGCRNFGTRYDFPWQAFGTREAK